MPVSRAHYADMQIHYGYVAPFLLILALGNTFYLRKQWLVVNQVNQRPIPEHCT
jgi:hypothetical protein